MTKPSSGFKIVLDCFAALAVTAASAHAALPVAAPSPDSGAPVLLSASRVDYDQDNGLVLASGKVEVSQGDMILLADQLLYDQPKNVVKARGNVSMLDATGTVYFAEEVELKDDLKAGVVRQFMARLSDDSVMVASGARKLDEDRLELFKAAYTPCHCRTEDGRPKSPQWQIRAEHVLVDQKEQKVFYDDATIEAYGVPVLYTPYFSHPTPEAANQSGLLVPEYQHSENLGSVFEIPFYYSIAPDKDTTITPIFTGQEGMVLAAEYRQLFDHGHMTLDGSITRVTNRDAQGDQVPGHEIRGHLDAVGYFMVGEDYDWGFDIHRASDDTYLRRYNFSHETVLTSRAYAEGFNFVGDSDRTYGSVEGLSFQGLTAQDDTEQIPIVLPLVTFATETTPGIYDSRFLFDGNMMALYRHTGAQSRRLSATTGWMLPYISDDGQVIEFMAQVRSDAYAVNDVQLSSGRVFDGTTGRLVPQVSTLWRMPFISRWQGGSVILEPVVMAALSPGGGNPEKIPNEDSLVPEFTDTNLFSPNRFPGYDRVETGPRIAYGLRGQAQLFSDKYVNWLFGQNWRLHNDRHFPFSNDLASHFSDYVGKIGLQAQPFDIAYRFRLNQETLAAQRNEIDASFYYHPIRVSGAYLSLKNDPILDNKENIGGTLTINLTDQWTWHISGNEDLELSQPTSISTGLVFKNECTEILTLVGREYTRDRDLEPSTNFLFRVSLKNLD